MYVCMYIYIYIESILIPVTVKKRDFHIGTPQKGHKANCYFGELVIGDLSDMVCVCVWVFFTCPTFLLSLQLFIQFTNGDLQLNIFERGSLQWQISHQMCCPD